MAQSALSDVLSLMKEMKATTAESLRKSVEASVEMIHADVKPPSHLIDKWEPDYVEGAIHKMKVGSLEFSITNREILEAHRAGENVRLVGPSGCGKSATAHYYADENNEPIRKKNREILKENIARRTKDGDKAKLLEYNALPYPLVHYNCDEGTRTADVIGDVTVMFDGNGERKPVTVPGCFTQAWTKGATLIFEEDDLAAPGVLGAAHPFLDGRTKSTNVFLNGMTTLHKHPRFRMIATSNSLGDGEAITEYAGTQILNTAYLNRFTYVVLCDYLPTEKEVDLLVGKTDINRDLARKMVDAVGNIRGEYKEKKITKVITTRDLLSWAREIKRIEKRQGRKVTGAD